MKKALSLLIAFAMLFSLGITANAAEKKELNIFMWSDYISDDLIADFEDEFGVRVNLSYMNDNADSITKLTAGAGSEYDLIMTCDAYMESLIAGGYLEDGPQSDPQFHKHQQSLLVRTEPGLLRPLSHELYLCGL